MLWRIQLFRSLWKGGPPLEGSGGPWRSRFSPEHSGEATFLQSALEMQTFLLCTPEKGSFLQSAPEKYLLLQRAPEIDLRAGSQ
jgi:hypothetical protein